jgi:hypothetical protein
MMNRLHFGEAKDQETKDHEMEALHSEACRGSLSKLRGDEIRPTAKHSMTGDHGAVSGTNKIQVFVRS